VEIQERIMIKIHLKIKKKILKINYCKYIFYFRPKDKFDKKDIIKILTELEYPFNKPEVDQWIW
jgi:hypothetical protein